MFRRFSYGYRAVKGEDVKHENVKHEAGAGACGGGGIRMSKSGAPGPAARPGGFGARGGPIAAPGVATWGNPLDTASRKSFCSVKYKILCSGHREGLRAFGLIGARQGITGEAEAGGGGPGVEDALVEWGGRGVVLCTGLGDLAPPDI